MGRTRTIERFENTKGRNVHLLTSSHVSVRRQIQTLASTMRFGAQGRKNTNVPHAGHPRRSVVSTQRRVVRVHAEDEKKEPDTVEVRFDLGEAIQSESANSSRGYLAEDSAGQENIFAVEPRVYVAGSEMDDGQGQGSSVLGAVLGLVAVGLVGSVLFLLKDQPSTPVEGSGVEEISSTISASEPTAPEKVEEEASQVAPEVVAD